MARKKMTAEERKKIDDEIRMRNVTARRKASEANAKRKAVNDKTSKGFKATEKSPSEGSKAKTKARQEVQQKGEAYKTNVGRAIANRKKKLKDI